MKFTVVYDTETGKAMLSGDAQVNHLQYLKAMRGITSVCARCLNQVSKNLGIDGWEESGRVLLQEVAAQCSVDPLPDAFVMREVQKPGGE